VSVVSDRRSQAPAVRGTLRHVGVNDGTVSQSATVFGTAPIAAEGQPRAVSQLELDIHEAALARGLVKARRLSGST